LWNGWKALGIWNELPDTVLRCFALVLVSVEETDDADVEPFDVVDEVRYKEEASEETFDNRDADPRRFILDRLG
jgi:hypothetical protein